MSITITNPSPALQMPVTTKPKTIDRKKVLFITQSLGGVETYIREIIENIDLDSFQIVMVAPPSDSLNATCRSLSIPVYNLNMARGFNPLLDIKNIWQFRNIIKKEKPDLLHVHSSKGGFLGRIAGRICSVKSILTPNGPSYLSFTGIKRMLFFLLEVAVKPATDKILAVSHSEAYRMQYEVGHSAEKIDVVLNSIRVEQMETRPVRPVTADRKIRIGMIARLTYQKNPILFVEVARLVVARYPNAEFSIMGAGLEDHVRPDVEKLIKQYRLEDNVKILAWDFHGGANSFLLSLDVFVLTSIFEGLPFSLLEAMALGIPCVVSKCDGCNDVIQNEVNGFACITKHDFFEAISKVLDNEEEAKRIGLAARDYVRSRHNIENAIKDIEKFYLETLKT